MPVASNARVSKNVMNGGGTKNKSKNGKGDNECNMELGQFMEWAEGRGYTIHDVVDGDKIGWNEIVIPVKHDKMFEEYLKDVWKFYMIKLGEEDILDYNPLVKEFKMSGSVKPGVCIIQSDETDTSDAGYIDTLEYSTAELRDALGEPFKTGKPGDKHRYEWIIEVGKNVYTIYDWVLDNGEFEPLEEAEWFIGGVNENDDDIKNIVEFINERKKLGVSDGLHRRKRTEEGGFQDKGEEDILKSVIDDLESIEF